MKKSGGEPLDFFICKQSNILISDGPVNIRLIWHGILSIKIKVI